VSTDLPAWTLVLLVAAGGSLGAVLRHVAGVLLAFGIRPVPEATLVVNVTASFALGLLVGAEASPGWLALLGIGTCGALSTYSTFALEVDRLAERGQRAVALEYVALTLVLGLSAAALGYALSPTLG
jgi:CrcB protein